MPEKIRIDAIIDDGIAQDDNVRIVGAEPGDRSLVEMRAQRNELADQRRQGEEAGDEERRTDAFAMLAGFVAHWVSPLSSTKTQRTET